MREFLTAVGCLLCLTAMAASLKLAGVIDWSWGWVLLPPAVAIAVLTLVQCRKN